MSEHQEEIQRAEEFLTGLVSAFGFEGTLRTDINGPEVTVSVDGDELGLLIGPRGATLEAIQDITRSVAQGGGPRSATRLRVDVSSYRERRRAALGRFAEQIADEVRSSGKPKALEPMNAADRKAVHDAVGDLEGVVSTSQGEDPYRFVVIVPAE